MAKKKRSKKAISSAIGKKADYGGKFLLKSQIHPSRFKSLSRK